MYGGPHSIYGRFARVAPASPVQLPLTARASKPLLLANIRHILPDIRHILRLSLLPLLYPYGRYLALLYSYRQDPAVDYIRHNHSIVFIGVRYRDSQNHDDSTSHTTGCHRSVRWLTPEEQFPTRI